jgi:Cdc6-like AAA superfamily ATPase
MQHFIDAYRYTTSGIYQNIQDVFIGKELNVNEIYIPSHQIGFNIANNEFNVFKLINPRTNSSMQRILFDKDIADELKEIVDMEAQIKKRKRVIEPEAIMYL